MKILFVDLGSKKLIWKQMAPEVTSKYLGGRGIGARFLYQELPAKVDPLGPNNILSFWTSPLMASGTLSMVKLCGMTKSPLTNTILMSLMGGHFGPGLRFSGADGLVITGVSNKPVYIFIDEGKAEIRSAEHLWGKSTRETEYILKGALGNKVKVASIGPAGENGVLFASIMHGGNAMGRGGIGTVMGSKRIKAIVVSGRIKPKLFDEARFKSILKKVIKTYKDSEALKEFGKVGSTRHVNGLNERKIYPVKNFQLGEFKDYKKVNSDVLNGSYVKKRSSCFACPVKCRRSATIDSGTYSGIETEGPEYETIWAFGGNCENSNIEIIIAANDLCLEYGLDTITTGSVISFAMECAEKGIISQQDTDGLNVSFDNPEVILELIHKIAHREGFGNILAKGTKKAAESIGQTAENYAMQVKGLELAAYEPRRSKGMGLGYATSPRGGCHERGYLLSEVLGADQYSYDGKGQQVKSTQDLVAVKDALGYCVFSSAGTSLQDLAELFSAATGIEKSDEDLLRDGERICNIERLFNLREGFTRKDDGLPDRFLNEPLLGENNKPEVVELDRLLDDYYYERGWNSGGVPYNDLLKRLELIESDLKSPMFRVDVEKNNR